MKTFQTYGNRKDQDGKGPLRREFKMTYEIKKDGFFYRARNIATGWESSMMTSASQAGLLIERKAGKDAHRAAALAFIA